MLGLTRTHYVFGTCVCTWSHLLWQIHGKVAPSSPLNFLVTFGVRLCSTECSVIATVKKGCQRGIAVCSSVLEMKKVQWRGGFEIKNIIRSIDNRAIRRKRPDSGSPWTSDLFLGRVCWRNITCAWPGLNHFHRPSIWAHWDTWCQARLTFCLMQSCGVLFYTDKCVCAKKKLT